jgi:hypothetical protein
VLQRTAYYGNCVPLVVVGLTALRLAAAMALPPAGAERQRAQSPRTHFVNTLLRLVVYSIAAVRLHWQNLKLVTHAGALLRQRYARGLAVVGKL